MQTVRPPNKKQSGSCEAGEQNDKEQASKWCSLFSYHYNYMVDSDGNVTFRENMDKLGWEHKIPGIAFVHELLFSAPMSPAKFKDMVDLFALIAALMLTVVIGGIGTVSSESIAGQARIVMQQNFDFAMTKVSAGEMVMYDEIFNATVTGANPGKAVSFCLGSNYCHREFPMKVDGISESIAMKYRNSLAFLGLVLFCSIVTSVHIGSSNFCDSKGKPSPRMMASWWSPFRWVFLCLFVFMILGVFHTLDLYKWIAYINLASFISDPNKIELKGITFKFGKGITDANFWQSYMFYLFVFILGALILLVLVISYAIYKKNGIYIQLQQEGVNKTDNSTRSVADDLEGFNPGMTPLNIVSSGSGNDADQNELVQLLAAQNRLLTKQNELLEKMLKKKS